MTLKGAIELGSDAIELHTGTYANASTTSAAQKELNRLATAAKMAHSAGLKSKCGTRLKPKQPRPLSSRRPSSSRYKHRTCTHK